MWAGPRSGGALTAIRNPPAAEYAAHPSRGQSLVKYASTARCRNVYGFPRLMMPRVISSLCAAGPASVARAKPASRAIRVSILSCGSSPAIASSTSCSRCGNRSRIRCTCASASPAASPVPPPGP